jgi:hypothetical protein
LDPARLAWVGAETREPTMTRSIAANLSLA